MKHETKISYKIFTSVAACQRVESYSLLSKDTFIVLVMLQSLFLQKLLCALHIYQMPVTTQTAYLTLNSSGGAPSSEVHLVVTVVLLLWGCHIVIVRVSYCYCEGVILLLWGCHIVIARVSYCYCEGVILLLWGCRIVIARVSYCYCVGVILLLWACHIVIVRVSYCYCEGVILNQYEKFPVSCHSHHLCQKSVIICSTSARN